MSLKIFYLLVSGRVIKGRLNNRTHINEQDIDGRTALIWANKNNHKTIAQLLQDNGAEAIQARYESMLP